MLPARTLDRIGKQNRWLREVCDVEEMALRMVVPIDLATMQPEIVEVRKGTLMQLHNYWRVVLSSEPQFTTFSGGGRSSALLIRDKVSGGFLGVVGLSDPPGCIPMMKLFGWDVNDDARLARQHQVTMMRRCLPIYEFGQMTGGKLLALMATSREIVRVMEMRFSFQYAMFVIRTLHGKGSQYNRLNQRGIELIEVDESGKGFYAMELRKKGVALHARRHALRQDSDVSARRAGRLLEDALASGTHGQHRQQLDHYARSRTLPAVVHAFQEAREPRSLRTYGGRRWQSH